MQGNSHVDNLMIPVSEAISRHIEDQSAQTDIYNRAYEAIMVAGKKPSGDAKLDKQKLLKWLKNEMDSCNITKHSDDMAIHWECERIAERINAGIFDSD